MNNKEVGLTFSLNQEMRNALKAKAGKKGQSVKSILNKLIEAYLNDNK